MKIVKEVEEYKNYSRRMFKVVKDLQRRKKKKKLVVDGKDGKITDE